MSPLAVVAGAVANKVGNGGEAWVRVSWVRALERLGFRVELVEEVAAAGLRGADGSPCGLGPSRQLAWFREVTTWAGLGGRSTLVVGGGPETWGRPWTELQDVAAQAELLVDISGTLRGPLLERFARRVLVDLDPGFTQVWAASGTPAADLGRYHHHLTVGANIGTPACPLPTAGVRWVPVRQPVVLDDWPVLPVGDPGRFTTVATWRNGFGPLAWAGRTYGLKHHEFRRHADLPRRTGLPLALAVDLHPSDHADRQLLVDGGWRLHDAAEVAHPDAFAAWVAGSGGEWSVAQGVYADTACGWFSDRSARYLASGRPVVVQDTGAGSWLPLGEGVVTFTTPEGAARALAEVVADHGRHARAARALAEEHLRPEVALAPLLELAGVRP